MEKINCYNRHEVQIISILLMTVVFTFIFWQQGKWDVPLPKVRGVSEAEVFKVVKSGKTKSEHYTTSAFLCLFKIEYVSFVDICNLLKSRFRSVKACV